MNLLAKCHSVVKTSSLIVLFAFIASCDSDGTNNSEPPIADVNPASSSTISGTSSIIVTFNASMAPASKTLAGTLSNESDGGIWSQTKTENDTLTISPATAWSSGNQTLTLDVESSVGTAIETLNLQYTVDTDLQVKSISPSNNDTILDQQAIVITFEEPVETSSLTGSGSLWSESDTGTWSDVTFSDDTLTISPTSTWTPGVQTLAISVKDSIGNQTTLMLNYTITTDGDNDGVTAAAGDCDDEEPAIFPGATEVCDGDDNNCDGVIDESGAVGEITFYIDTDGDTYGDPLTSQLACYAPTAYVDNNLDCNDDVITGGSSIFPGNTEVCDGLDNDCANGVDDNLVEPTDACEVTVGGVTCTGSWSCTGAGGWLCDAPTPVGGVCP